MDQQLAAAQALKYAEELRELHEIERAHRRGVEEALRRLEESYGTTVRALATTLELRDDATGEHAERVTRLALRLSERVAPRLCRGPAARIWLPAPRRRQDRRPRRGAVEGVFARRERAAGAPATPAARRADPRPDPVSAASPATSSSGTTSAGTARLSARAARDWGSAGGA